MLSVAAILSLVVAAVLANHTSVLAIAEWAALQPLPVRRALGFHRGTTPHQTTLQRLLARLDPAAVSHIFDPHTSGEVRARGSQGVAVDGKAQRARLRNSTTPTAPVQAVSAFCHDLGGILAQLVVDAKLHQSELTLAPELLRQLDWQGRVLTGDALYCQQALCSQVVQAGGDYLMIVKQNQPNLLADIEQVFALLSAEERARTGVHTVQPLEIRTYRSVEKSHGRLEERQIRVSSELQGYAGPIWRRCLNTPASGPSKALPSSKYATASRVCRLRSARRHNWQRSNVDTGRWRMDCMTSKM